MARIIPIDLIKGMSGKVCKHSDTYFNYNTSSGKMFTGKVCNPYTGGPTAKQEAQYEKFKVMNEHAVAWLNANKPNGTNLLGTDDYRLAQSIKKQLGLGNVRQVVIKYMDASGKVTLPGGKNNTVTGGGGTTPSGGGGSSAGLDDDESF